MCENIVYWKKIPDFPNYECSTSGEFRRNGKLLKTAPHQKGYRNIRLYKCGKPFIFRAHRVIFSTFSGLTSNQEINHKNGIKDDNALNNLEVCTRSENLIHAYKTGLAKIKLGKENKLSKPLVAKHIKTGDVLYFDSQADAKRAGFSQGCIQLVLTGKRNHHKGYDWSYPQLP